MKPELTDDITLRTATTADYQAIAHIELEAGKRFREIGYRQSVRTQPRTPMAMADRLVGKSAFLAEDRNGQAIGFAVGGDLGGIFWIYDLSVLTTHDRRGIGTQLLQCMIERANWAYHRAIGLSCFANAAFNAPFFAKAGFMKANPLDVKDAGHGEIYRQFIREIPEHVSPKDRVLMFKYL